MQPNVDNVLDELKELDRLLKQRRVGLSDLGPLAFCNIPLANAAPLHLQPPCLSTAFQADKFSLRQDALENTQYLQIEEWILHTHAYIDTLLGHHSTEVKLYASIIHADLEDCGHALERYKLLEWDRQRSSGCPLIPTMPCHEDRIDTG